MKPMIARTKVGLASLSLATLSACNQTPVPAQKSDEPPIGRWQIVSAPMGADVPSAVLSALPPTKQPAVWRLDTQSGTLEFCNVSGKSFGAVECGLPETPHP